MIGRGISDIRSHLWCILGQMFFCGTTDSPVLDSGFQSQRATLFALNDDHQLVMFSIGQLRSEDLSHSSPMPQPLGHQQPAVTTGRFYRWSFFPYRFDFTSKRKNSNSYELRTPMERSFVSLNNSQKLVLVTGGLGCGCGCLRHASLRPKLFLRKIWQNRILAPRRVDATSYGES